jgi:hypothetical protein
MLPEIDATDINPQTSECTRYRISLDLCSFAWEGNLGMLAKRAPFAYSMLLNTELWKTCDYRNRQV